MTAKTATASNSQGHRSTLFLEEARITDVSRYPGEQFVIRMHAPRCAATANPGSFVHVQCDESIPMRRPLSIMRVNSRDGWIEILFKTVGAGLHALGEKNEGDEVSVIGPIGHGFEADAERPAKLLIGGGVGIPPMIFLAERMLDDDTASQPLVIMGSEIPFPFELESSNIPTSWLPDSIDSTMPLLEEWRIPARLASQSGFAGCYQGYVTDLAREWLSSLSATELTQTEVFSCGPTPMLQAVAKLARDFDLPCQVSLEEFMACAVGGCAGCTVLVNTDDGPAMKRVCVDGPVFESSAVFPAKET
ncbi:MAG: dihydroorotate dehydrogenase electron transfer subunit [Woeseiaceae bacterium]